jgi:hypothetical protein
MTGSLPLNLNELEHSAAVALAAGAPCRVGEQCHSARRFRRGLS